MVLMKSPSGPSDRVGPLSTYLLPRYVRYARTLALLGAGTVGFAAGTVVLSSAGCNLCSGTPCPGQTLVGDTHPKTDAAADGSAVDAGVDGSHSGGPGFPPVLPLAWMA